jgi:hypothetical protein
MTVRRYLRGQSDDERLVQLDDEVMGHPVAFVLQRLDGFSRVPNLVRLFHHQREQLGRFMGVLRHGSKHVKNFSSFGMSLNTAVLVEPTDDAKL